MKRIVLFPTIGNHIYFLDISLKMSPNTQIISFGRFPVFQGFEFFDNVSNVSYRNLELFEENEPDWVLSFFLLHPGTGIQICFIHNLNIGHNSRGMGVDS